MSVCDQRKVAFFVGQSSHCGAVSDDCDFHFDSLVTNVGNAYSHGRFRAPCRATYQFNVTISARENQKVVKIAYFRTLEENLELSAKSF